MALRINHPGYVACEQRTNDFSISYEGELKGILASKLLAAAERFKKRPVELLAEALEKLIEDDLFAAVLDDG